MFRSHPAAPGRTPVILWISACVIASSPLAVRAQSGDGIRWEDRPDSVAGEFHATDVNESPLYLLSEERVWGISGAAAIGRNRAGRAFSSRRDFAARTGLPPLPGYVYGSSHAGERWDWEWRAVKNGEFTGRSGRALWRRGHWSIPVRWEGDGGLERWNDRSTAAISWKREGTTVVFGHFDLRWGNGFLVDSSPGWGAPSRPAADKTTRLRPYDSRVENRALFGPAALFERGSWKLGVGLSRHRRDARIDRNGLVSSWDDSGYHRTHSERRSHARVRESLATGFGEMSFGLGRITFAAFAVSYDPAWSGGNVERKPDAMRGDRVSGVSAGARFPCLGTDLYADIAATGLDRRGAGRLSIRRSGVPSFQITWQRLGERFHAIRSGAYHRLRSSPRGQESVIALGRLPGLGGTISTRILLYRSLGRTFFEPGGESGAEFRTGWERGALRVEWEGRREWDSGVPRDRVRRGARFRFRGSVAGVEGSVAPFWVRQQQERTAGISNASGAGAVIRWGPFQVSLVRLIERDAALVLPAVTLGGGFPARAYGRGSGPWRARGSMSLAGPGRLEAGCVFAEGEWGVLLKKSRAAR